MKVFVKTFSSLARNWVTTCLEVQSSDIVGTIKHKVLDEGVSLESKILQFNGETLPENLTLAECLVDDGSELFVVDRAEFLFKSNDGNVTNDRHEVKENLSRQDQDEIKHDSNLNLLPTTCKDIQRNDVHGKSDVPEDIQKQDKTAEPVLAAEPAEPASDNAQKVLAAEGTEEVHVVRYFMSVEEALEFRSSHRRFFVVLCSQGIDTVTKVCSAVSAYLHITFAVTFLQDVADVLLGGEHAETHCFVDSEKLEFFYNSDLVLEELLKFLEECMGKKCCKSLK